MVHCQIVVLCVKLHNIACRRNLPPPEDVYPEEAPPTTNRDMDEDEAEEDAEQRLALTQNIFA